MRKTRVFGQLLGVQGMVIGDVTMHPDPDGDGEILVVSVRPDARSASRCAQCRRRCPGYDTGVGTRRWRTVDTGTMRTFLEAAAPRVHCPDHGVLVAHVPWARPAAKCTHLLEDTCAWLAKNMALTAVTVFLRLSWRTVAAIVARVVQDLTGKTDQLDGLTRIGIDEISPFHVVKLATDALDAVRRQVWRSARRYPDKTIARKFKGARWALLKKPSDLTDKQAETLAALRKSGGALWRAYQLKEALRAVFAGDLTAAEVIELLDRWCSRAQRSRIPEFVKAARTIRKQKDGITAAVDRGMSNGRHEGLKNKIRTMINRAYGFHSAEAALALIILACGPVTLELPYHTGGHPHSCH